MSQAANPPASPSQGGYVVYTAGSLRRMRKNDLIQLCVAGGGGPRCLGLRKSDLEGLVLQLQQQLLNNNQTLPAVPGYRQPQFSVGVRECKLPNRACGNTCITPTRRCRIPGNAQPDPTGLAPLIPKETRARQCKEGVSKACGNTCIPLSYDCHVNDPNRPRPQRRSQARLFTPEGPAQNYTPAPSPAGTPRQQQPFTAQQQQQRTPQQQPFTSQQQQPFTPQQQQPFTPQQQQQQQRTPQQQQAFTPRQQQTFGSPPLQTTPQPYEQALLAAQRQAGRQQQRQASAAPGGFPSVGERDPFANPFRTPIATPNVVMARPPPVPTLVEPREPLRQPFALQSTQRFQAAASQSAAARSRALTARRLQAGAAQAQEFAPIS